MTSEPCRLPALVFSSLALMIGLVATIAGSAIHQQACDSAGVQVFNFRKIGIGLGVSVAILAGLVFVGSCFRARRPWVVVVAVLACLAAVAVLGLNGLLAADRHDLSSCFVF